MATHTYNGTYSDRIQCVFTYNTSQTDSAVTITVKSELQAKSYYLSGYKVSSSISGAVVKTATGYVPNLYTSWTTFLTADSASKTITRTKVAQTITIASEYEGAGSGGYNAGVAKGSYSTTINVPAKPKYTISYNANSGSGAPSSQDKWYNETLTLSSTRPTRTGYTFQGWATSSSATTATYQPGGSYTVNSAATLYAVWKINTYTITYNANEGSGAPSAQTKTYNVALTLSSTKPTRTGYTFLGWSASSSATTATWSAGGTYPAGNNANATIYAVWRINTYTVTYNANGGTNAPSAGTKTYNVTYTVSQKGSMTREGYNFLNWNTKADGSGTTYNAGSNYTANAAVTLYAQWEIAYINPVITGIGTSNIPTVVRSDSSGQQEDDGTYALIEFKWEVDPSATGSEARLYFKLPSADWPSSSPGKTTVQLSGTSGTVSQVIGAGTVDTDYSYDVRIVVEDNNGKTTTFNTVISQAYFTLDFRAGGRGIGVGTIAPNPSGHADGLLKIAMDLVDGDDDFVDAIRHPVNLADDKDLNNVVVPGVYRHMYSNSITNQPESGYLHLFVIGSKTNTPTFIIQIILYHSTGRTYIRRRTSGGVWQPWLIIGGDQIVEQGISGIWHYRKWASGYAEADGVYTFTPSSWTTSNNIARAYTPQIPLPFTFPKLYTSQAGVQAGPYVSWASSNVTASPDSPATNRTYVMALVMQFSNTTLSTIRVAFHVTGTWK